MGAWQDMVNAVAAANTAYENAQNARVINGQQGMLATYGPDTAGMRAAVEARDAAQRAYDASQASVSVNQASPAPPPAASAPIPAPPPAPVLPQFRQMQPNYKTFKVAPIDTIQFDDNAVEIAMITDLLFEDIGAVELANISRTDLIDGIEVLYAPIKNLSIMRRDYNPNNIVATSYSTDYFSRFGIDLSTKGIHEPYFDDNGNLVVEIDIVSSEEEIQVQILTNGTISEVNDI